MKKKASAERPRHGAARRQSANPAAAIPRRGPDGEGLSLRGGSNEASPDRWRPWLLAAATALIVARMLWPSESAATAGDGLPVIMLWLAVWTAWMLAALGPPRFRLRFGPVDAAVAALVAWHTIAGVRAAATATPRPAVNMLWEWIGLGVAFVMLRNLVTTGREARALAAALMAVVVGLSVYGLYQVAVDQPATWAEYQRNPEAALRAAEIPTDADPAQRELFEKRLETFEPLATFALTNSLAGVLVAWLVIGAALAAAPEARWAPRWWHVAALAAGGLIVATCLWLTHSRAALAAGVMGCALVAVRRLAGTSVRRRRAAAVALGVVAVAVFLLTLLGALVIAAASRGETDHPWVGAAAKSLGYRFQYWRASAELIARHPWFGCGPGNFQNAYTAHKSPLAGEEIADPHNFLFELAATAGAPAGTALVAALGAAAWIVVRGLSNRRKDNLECSDWIPEPARDRSCGEGTIRDGSRLVAAGAAVGFVLAVPLGALSDVPPGAIVLLLVAPAAAAAWLPFRAWIEQGRFPAFAPAVGLLTITLHLSASGGIGYPGVAGSFWVLLALVLHLAQQRSPGEKGLGSSDAAPRAESIPTPPRAARGGTEADMFAWSPDDRWLSRRWAGAGLSAALLLAIGCYATAYRPVLECQGYLRAAETLLARGAVGAGVERLQDAAGADPLAARPWSELAAIELQSWSSPPTRRQLEGLRTLIDTMLRREPNSAVAWHTAGNWYLEAARKCGGAQPALYRRALTSAIESLRRAVVLYPTSAKYRARLAEACLVAGLIDPWRREAAEALRLDQLTPHANQKLPDELRRAIVERLDDQHSP